VASLESVASAQHFIAQITPHIMDESTPARATRRRAARESSGARRVVSSGVFFRAQASATNVKSPGSGDARGLLLAYNAGREKACEDTSSMCNKPLT
jgi:hypothetical protein